MSHAEAKIVCTACDWEGTPSQLQRIGKLHVCPVCKRIDALHKAIDGHAFVKLDPKTLTPEN